jgi:anhydro-N-acetylmuramic acid kinase
MVCGIMSGTSLDAIDVVLLRLRGSGRRTQFSQVAYGQIPIRSELRARILRCSDPANAVLDEIVRLNVYLAHVYADAVRTVARRAGVKMADIDLIGSHGQTIRHLPNASRMHGKAIRATLQIGDPSVLATLIGVPVVGDFRLADMAVGGQGAPLVPLFDWLIFGSPDRNRVLLNIGGIANVTILPRGCSRQQVIAFDTGPGNMLVDFLMNEYFGRSFDRNGRVAFRGAVNVKLLRWMATHPFFRRRPPKSTGREDFGSDFGRSVMRRSGKLAGEDVIATASFLTPFSVFDAVRRFVPAFSIHEVIASGGGAHNAFFLRVLQLLFEGATIRTTGEFGVDVDAKEATCFAVLANETMHRQPANLPSVTGARREVVLGKVCRP